jgi:hypothetical protein
MALINRIEVVNYLGEGWQPSMGVANWTPLWPANVMRLAGHSSAIQIPNGCGKTSVTAAILYLLSRDRVLKRQFLDRCAPVGMVPSHIRIEFAILTDENLTQRDLMTRDPLDCPAQTYVIGVCANRSEDTIQFYRYAGMLEDAPACTMDGTVITFKTKEALRDSVKKIKGGKWGGWDTVAEWSTVVGEFMSAEVVRQNVQFQRDGAGDASATFSKVVSVSGERFDEAYFRQIVAPQLLSNMMGESAEEGERLVEDTIMRSMTRFIDAKLAVEAKEAYVKRRTAMEVEFQPVLEAASAIQGAESSFQNKLQALAVDSAFLKRFVLERDGRIPGAPRPLAELTFAAGIKECLEGMVLDKDGTILIEGAALATLLGLNTGHLNQLAARVTGPKPAIPTSPTSSQVIDLYCDIKISEGAGGRRKAYVFYGLRAALDLADRRSEHVDARVAILEEAFRAAEQLVDTNPFRHQSRRVHAKRAELKQQTAIQERAGRDADAERLRLEKQVKERAENQGAYQEFCAQLELLPKALRDTPSQVPAWLENEAIDRMDAVSKHATRVGLLTLGWEDLQKLRGELSGLSLQERLGQLEESSDRVKATRSEADAALADAQKRHEASSTGVVESQQALNKTSGEFALLAEDEKAYDTYRAIFGNVDPIEVAPPQDEKNKLTRKSEQTAGLHRTALAEQSKLSTLRDGHTLFKGLFGDIDPKSAKPMADLERLQSASAAASATFSQHQPLAEALEFHKSHSELAPSTWIAETDLAHRRALEEERLARQRAADRSREIAALDDLALVGDSDYAEAHDALKDAGIPAKRVRDAILELTLAKEKALPLLAAFGPILNAPVLPDLAAADKALVTLQAGGHEVPLVLSQALDEALRAGLLSETATAASVLFLAGPKSRRIRAIVDPQALEEERKELQVQRDAHLQTAAEAKELAGTLSPHTDHYTMALKAVEAVRHDSTNKAEAASKELADLEAKLIQVKKLTTPEALKYLAEAVDFVRMGGEDALTAVMATVKAHAEELERIATRLREIEPFLTHEAIVAHAGARKFALAGGHRKLQELQAAHAKLAAQVEIYQGELVRLAPQLTDLKTALATAQQDERKFGATYQSQRGRLERAGAMESNGEAEFMENHVRLRKSLADRRDELNPLRAINYERAQAFKDLQGQDEAELARLIGVATNNRDKAQKFAVELQAQFEKLEGVALEASGAAESLHELAHFLTERRRSVAPFEQDLVGREFGAARAEAHALFARMDDLRDRLLNWIPDDGPFDRNLIASLRNEVEDIDVAQTGKEVADARKQTARTKERFTSTRAAFCAKARTQVGEAFSEGEIDAIEAAQTTAQLQELVKIGERLRADLETEQSNLAELQLTATTTERESIHNLSRMVDGCRHNLTIMNAVMGRNQNARFIIHADIISPDDIEKLMLDLRDHIENRKRDAKSRQTLTRRHNIDLNLSGEVRNALIDRVFTNPSVQFLHIGMWDGKAHPIQPSLSEGQKAALQMLWLIKESEYHLECAVRRYVGGGARKKLRSRAQRILFFDGLFSNLTDRALIDEAFKGLGDSNSNLQLVGLIHNPEYRNNHSIFPTLIIGRRAGWRDVEGERSFVRFEDGRPDGSLGLATFMVKQPPTIGEEPTRA